MINPGGSRVTVQDMGTTIHVSYVMTLVDQNGMGQEFSCFLPRIPESGKRFPITLLDEHHPRKLKQGFPQLVPVEEKNQSYHEALTSSDVTQ